MSEPVFVEHPDRWRFDRAISEELEKAIRAGVQNNGRAWLALAGGSTPGPAYRLLDGMALEWPSVQLVATDERWVSAEHELSNAGMFRREMAQAFEAGCGLVELSSAPEPIESGIETVADRLDPSELPFDLVLLGMGSDGHTASLFPDDPGLEALMFSDRPVGIARPPSQPTARLSLTPAWICRSRVVLLAITGETKREVLNRALADPDSDLPIRRVLDRCSCPIMIHYCP